VRRTERAARDAAAAAAGTVTIAVRPFPEDRDGHPTANIGPGRVPPWRTHGAHLKGNQDRAPTRARPGAGPFEGPAPAGGGRSFRTKVRFRPAHPRHPPHIGRERSHVLSSQALHPRIPSFWPGPCCRGPARVRDLRWGGRQGRHVPGGAAADGVDRRLQRSVEDPRPADASPDGALISLVPDLARERAFGGGALVALHPLPTAGMALVRTDNAPAHEIPPPDQPVSCSPPRMGPRSAVSPARTAS
jgi:hypothetical protein